MRYGHLLSVLSECSPQPVSRDKLCEDFGISDRTLWKNIKDLKHDGLKNGFQIKTVRGKGFCLGISNEAEFKGFTQKIAISENRDRIISMKQRLNSLEFILLLAGDFMTLRELSERLNVSVSTIKDDLKKTESFFRENSLKVSGKPRFGILVEGEEDNKRKAIIGLFRTQLSTLVITPEYEAFTKMIDERALRETLEASLEEHDYAINDLLLKNVIEHVRLLIFRLLRKNYVNEKAGENIPSDDIRVETLVHTIVDYIEEYYDLIVPDFEIIYLRRQMIGKLSYVENKQKSNYIRLIDNALKNVDLIYKTKFRLDNDLQDYLLIHLATLVKRLSINHQLDNPLIDDIYVKYANVINISMDFTNYINNKSLKNISKDELGYFAIYFAASLERQKLLEMENYRKIIILTEDGRGAGYLLETGIKRLFPKSKIKTVSKNQLARMHEKVDLIISAVSIDNKEYTVPVIEIEQLLSLETLEKVEKSVRLLNEDPNFFLDDIHSILHLFNEENFSIVTDEHDYLALLKKKGLRLESMGAATPDFSKSVIDREQKISTVYDFGVAGPHPMASFAKKEVIDVTIVTNEMQYQQKEVKIIFLINIRQGHLTLHQEISRMMIELIKDRELRELMYQVKDYPSFISYITTAIKRR